MCCFFSLDGIYPEIIKSVLTREVKKPTTSRMIGLSLSPINLVVSPPDHQSTMVCCSWPTSTLGSCVAKPRQHSFAVRIFGGVEEKCQGNARSASNSEVRIVCASQLRQLATGRPSMCRAHQSMQSA